MLSTKQLREDIAHIEAAIAKLTAARGCFLEAETCHQEADAARGTKFEAKQRARQHHALGQELIAEAEKELGQRLG